MSVVRSSTKLAAAVCLGWAMAVAFPAATLAKDLGIEGQIYEPIEEDMRVMLMKLIARQDWSESLDELKDSAKNYTRNLPAYSLPKATKTATVWKDVGIVVSEDIYLPWVEWETGSVFEPGQRLAVQKGTYLNPVAKLPSAAIERLFIFDATDPEQLTFAKELMAQNVPQLSFMLIAGDLGELSTELNRPIYHPPPTMLDKFHITAVPSLIGFGRGAHQGHMAITTFKLPSKASNVQDAWFGLPYKGYDPMNIADIVADSSGGPAAAEEAIQVFESIATSPAKQP